jgi:hypothetical protein
MAKLSKDAIEKMPPHPWSWSLTPGGVEEKDWKDRERQPADGFNFVERGGVIWHEKIR